jgi:signal transduction histidine kinase
LRDIVQEQGGMSVDVQSELSETRLPADTETALYRIAQEAFTNVLKHAAASRVTLRLTRREDTVTLVVHDDGKGFDTASVRDGSLGLVGMRERVALLGGRLTIESSEGAGTMLKAEVPIR